MSHESPHALRPSISVIVNTDGRAGPLRNTIESFRHLDYPVFEVVVVVGPTPDGTREVAQEYAAKGWIKYYECPERNLSMSRNIGIKNAAGEIIAFIDDDGIPEPEWLAQLAPAYDDAEVGGAGGLVHDQTGYTFQYLYAACNRLGEAIIDLMEPAEQFNFPFSERFPYVQGTNGSFRRSTIVEIGGFDEEIEFYLDETDVCCRIVDAGMKIRQLDNAIVHHKFLPSGIRNENRITTVKYPVIKNKIYFSFVNNRGHHPLNVVIESAMRFAAQQRADLEFHVNGGRLRPVDLEAFDEDLERALRVGFTRGLAGERRTRPPAYFADPPAFHSFPRLVPDDGPRRTFVFLCQTYPPEHPDGTGRLTHDIARAIAARGHTVHVLTKGMEFNRVDLEEGVWVHRLPPKSQPKRPLPDGTEIPAHIWNYAATQLEELYRIASRRRIDAVEGVSWDCECIATVLDGCFPSATNIVTSLAHWLDTHERHAVDTKWMGDFGTPMLAVETYLYKHAPGIIAASRAIAESVAERYRVNFDRSGVGYIPHAVVDTSDKPRKPIAALTASTAKRPILFVGRLELRKGIDVLLAAAPQILAADSESEIWIAGDDAIEIEPGITARKRFEASPAAAENFGRVHFLGRVSDEELRWLYARCEVFVAPSRFESFGLMLVEAMTFSKACVGARAGGMPEVIAEGISGLLAEPDNATSLAEAVITLLKDDALRAAYGRSGRARYKSHFEADAIARHRIAYLTSLARRPLFGNVVGDAREISVGYNQTATLLMPGSALAVTARGTLYVTAWMHPWSGIARVQIDGRDAAELDLYAPEGVFGTFEIPCPANADARVVISRGRRKNPVSQDTEVIVASLQVRESAMAAAQHGEGLTTAQ